MATIDGVDGSRTRITEVTKRIEGARAEDALARRLATIPGIGALTASALAATTPEVDTFRSARDYAA
ncbi:MAG: transposase, partial [Alkalilacustris sp.]